MKKVGIITHPLIENYGGIMQAIALYGFLEAHGYEPFLIRKHRYRPWYKNLMLKTLEVIPFQNFRNYRWLAKKRNIQKSFIENNIKNKTEIIYTSSQVRRAVCALGLDAVIVGSDQVWRMSSIDDGYYSVFFLNFIESAKVKKIAYAASFGTDVWESRERTIEVKEMLKDFSAISVREASGIDICRNEFGLQDCMLVADPTLLVCKSFYDRFTMSSTTESEGVVAYILDKDSAYNNIINRVGSYLKVDNITNISSGTNGKLFSTSEWLSKFSKANFIITDSFHGMIFSIIFNKQFLVIGNRKRGLARFESLLKHLGIEQRLLDKKDIDLVDINKIAPISYQAVNLKIEKLREKSAEYLQDALL